MYSIDANVFILPQIYDLSVESATVTAKLIRSESFDMYYPEDGLREINRYREYIISKRKTTIYGILSKNK
jgi:hypothetical protein